MKSAEAVQPGSLEFQVEFIHPATMLGLADAEHIDDLLADTFYGASATEVQDIRLSLTAVTREAAAQIAMTPKLRQAMERNFKPGQTIAAVGDSLTDDIRSWAYMLAHALTLVFPENPPTVLNFGKSGDTTMHVVEKMRSVLEAEPDVIIFLVGTNDAKSFTFAPDVALVAPVQSARNVAILNAAARESGARVVWMLPPLADEHIVAESPYWDSLNMSFSNERLAATRAAITTAVAAIDIEAVYQEYPRGDVLLADGLHPNPLGQLLIVQHLLACL